MNEIIHFHKTSLKLIVHIFKCALIPSIYSSDSQLFVLKYYWQPKNMNMNIYLYKSLYELLPPSGWMLLNIQALQQYTYVQRGIIHWKPLPLYPSQDKYFLNSTYSTYY